MKLILQMFIVALISLSIGCKPNVARKVAKNIGDDVAELFSSNEGKLTRKLVGAGAKIAYRNYEGQCRQCGGRGIVSCGNCGATGQIIGMDPRGNPMLMPCPVCTGRGLPPSMQCRACQ